MKVPLFILMSLFMKDEWDNSFHTAPFHQYGQAPFGFVSLILKHSKKIKEFAVVCRQNQIFDESSIVQHH